MSCRFVRAKKVVAALGILTAATVLLTACTDVSSSPNRTDRASSQPHVISPDRLADAFLSNDEIEQIAGRPLTFASSEADVTQHALWLPQPDNSASLSDECARQFTAINGIQKVSAATVAQSATNASTHVGLETTHFPTVASASRARMLAAHFMVACGASLRGYGSISRTTSSTKGATGLRLTLNDGRGSASCAYGALVNVIVSACAPTQAVADALLKAEYAEIWKVARI